ncbi:MAG: cell division protein FtsL [Deltaproteobacteria bacterium]|nr:cell division protein FtsL [Deltaproteobacteria bacterium]
MQAVGKINIKGGVITRQDVRLTRDLKDMSFIYLSLALAILFIVVASFYIWCRLTVVNTAYDISMLHSERSVLVESNKRLKMDLSRLKSPKRIEEIALKQGLVYPGSDQVIVVK